MTKKKNAFTLALIAAFIAATYASIAFSVYAPTIYLFHSLLYLLTVHYVNMETGYLFAILGTLSGIAAIAAMDSKAAAPWIIVETAVLWSLVIFISYWNRRINSEWMQHHVVAEKADKELANLHRELQAYQARVASVQAQADLRNKLSRGVSLLGKSLSPGDIQNSIKEAVSMNFPDCQVSLVWFRADGGDAGLDPFELWVKDKRHSILVPDTMQDERFRSHFEKGGFLYPYRCLALAPLSESASSERRGAIKVQAKQQGRLSKDDLRILDLYARLGTLAFENAGLHQQAVELAVHDPLTGLFTRRVFDERLERECANASRYKVTLVAALVDIDHFKHINDRYGHLGGDKVLAAVAKVLKESVRDVDFVARYGGEEFIIVFPETSKENAVVVMEGIRRHVESTPIMLEGGESVKPTISVGVASYPEETTGSRQLLRAADERLYLAKGSGRNRVVAG